MVDAFNKQGADASESALEQTFADLANARLRDRSPALLDYLVGFQLIKSNDDGSKAVGIFGFEVGDAWHYAPVFFMNGEVKGLDAVYSVDSDMFFPLSEDWINQIINRRPNQLGEVDKRSRQEAGVRTPNYSRLSQLPGAAGRGFQMGKRASVVDAMLAQRDTQDLMPLPHLIASMGVKVASGFIEDIRKLPKLAAAVGEFYQLTDFYVPTVKTAEALDDQIKIIAKVDEAGAKDLTEAQKKELLYGGEAIVDNRPDESKSIVYRTELRQTLQNPTKGGLYDVVMADGTIGELLLLSVSGGGGCYLVYEPGSGRHGLIPSQEIFVLREHDGAEFRNVLDRETTKPSSAQPGDCSVFCTDTGECTKGFEIEDVSKGALTNLRLRGSYWIAMEPSRGGFLDSSTWDWQHDHNSRVRDVLVSDAGASSLRFLQDRLLVNDKRCRALKLNTLEKHKDGNGFGYSRYAKEQDEITLRTGDMGDHTTIRCALEKVAAPVKVWRTDDDVVVKDQHGTQTFSKVAALGYLMRRHGCDATDARLIVKEASQGPTIYRIKYAASLLPFPEVNGPQDGNEMSAHHQTEIPQRAFETAPDADPSSRSAYEYNSPFAGGEGGGKGGQSTTGAVERAGQTGQKEVFDASVLTNLIKTHNPTDMVERFLPTIVSGMDRLGRLLFLMNWFFEEFQERYGDDELVDFSDDLKSTFEALGDIVLFMKKKTLSGDPDFYGLGMNSNVQG